MANEVTITVDLRLSNGKLQTARSEHGLQFDQTTAGYSSGVQTIGHTAAEVIDISEDIIENGYAFLRNLDDENYIEIGIATGISPIVFEPFSKLEAGQAAVIPLSNIDYFAQANVADCKLEFVVLDR